MPFTSISSLVILNLGGESLGGREGKGFQGAGGNKLPSKNFREKRAHDSSLTHVMRGFNEGILNYAYSNSREGSDKKKILEDMIWELESGRKKNWGG